MLTSSFLTHSLRARMLALIFGLAFVPPAFAQRAAEPPHPQIVVTGEATISVEPDIAQLNAGVVTEAKTAREAAEQNSRAMTAVRAAIRALGIADNDIRTSRYAVMPVYEPNKPVRERLTGFRATNSMLIKVRNPDTLGDVIDKLVAAGANQMGGIDFIVNEPSKRLDEARKQAVADARQKAELYAAAAGVTLGRPINITEQSAGMERGPVMMARAAAPETPIAPGERSLRVSVSMTFELQ